MPGNPPDKTFDELCALPKKHFHQEPFVILEKSASFKGETIEKGAGRSAVICFRVELFGRNLQAYCHSR